MSRYSYRLVLSVLAWTFLAGCSPEDAKLDPATLPQKLELVYEDAWFIPVDLNSDGRDERVSFAIETGPWNPSHVTLREHDGQLIRQVHYAAPIDNPRILDLDHDGMQEIAVPYVRNDSLFVSFVDRAGEKLNTYFLIAGAPRSDEDGLLIWDPRVRAFFLEDVDADGLDELITIIATGYARSPRGILIHSLEDGRLLGQYPMGTIPNEGQIYLSDVDGDGRRDLILATGASNNGAVANGTDDSHSYLAVFNLGLPPERVWQEEMGGLKTDMYLFSGDLDGQGGDEFLAFKQTLRGSSTPAYLRVIDPTRGKSDQEIVLDEPTTGIAMVDLDRDGKAEILALGVSGELKVLNEKLEIVKRRRVAKESVYRGRNSLTVLPDADGDGIDEIVVETSHGFVFLDSELDVKAALQPGAYASLGILRQGVGKQPLVYATHGGKIYVYRLTENRMYLARRYGPWLLWGVYAGSWVLVFVLGLMLWIGKKGIEEEKAILQALREKKERELEQARRLTAELKRAQQRIRQNGRSNDPSIEPAQKGELARIHDIIIERYGDSTFSVADLACEMGWSTKKLQRFFQNTLGFTPSKYIWQYRLDQAREMMGETGSIARISEIAYAVGFKSANHFSTRFKETFDVTPTEYLKEQQLQSP